MKKIYITGVSGTGKSTLAVEFQKRGYYSIDIDNVKGLCHWVNKETKEEGYYYSGIGREFLDSHDWICDIEKLKEIFTEHKDENIAVFGILDNEDEFLPLFDKIFLLKISEEVASNRVDSRTNHDFGKHSSEKEWIKSWQNEFEDNLIEKGAILINAEEPKNIIADKILSQI
jgi:broad-specificity NMP kinase